MSRTSSIHAAPAPAAPAPAVPSPLAPAPLLPPLHVAALSHLMLALLLALPLPWFAGCSTTSTAISRETDASEAISAAKHVAYWMDVDLSNVRNPDEATKAEIDRLKAAGARLSVQAEALEEELEAATVARVDKKSSEFADRGPMKTRYLKEQTIQVRTQWEAFLRRLDQQDAAERPGGSGSGDPSIGASGASGAGGGARGRGDG